MNDRIDRLLAVAERQQATIIEQGRQIAQQREQIGLLVESVALLLGEEIGTPVPDEAEGVGRVDLDGNGY